MNSRILHRHCNDANAQRHLEGSSSGSSSSSSSQSSGSGSSSSGDEAAALLPFYLPPTRCGHYDRAGASSPIFMTMSMAITQQSLCHNNIMNIITFAGVYIAHQEKEQPVNATVQMRQGSLSPATYSRWKIAQSRTSWQIRQLCTGQLRPLRD